ncbi:hypothetical protein Hdeb2414_s0023g00639931 [Helianthus debilis subsp. tardiflorus]
MYMLRVQTRWPLNVTSLNTRKLDEETENLSRDWERWRSLLSDACSTPTCRTEDGESGDDMGWAKRGMVVCF